MFNAITAVAMRVWDPAHAHIVLAQGGEVNVTKVAKARLFDPLSSKVGSLDARVQPLYDKLGVTKASSTAAEAPASRVVTAEEIELAQAEKQKIQALSRTLTHIAALSAVNNAIGHKTLSFEELKAFTASPSPYGNYLKTLCWWRRIIAFLILFLFVHPTIKLVLQGSGNNPGAIENIKNRLTEIATNPTKWRHIVNNIFRYLGETINEATAIAEAGHFDPDSKKLAWEERNKIHGYDHGKALEGLNNWLIEAAGIKSDVPLIGPLIEKIIKGSLGNILRKQDFVTQILQLTSSPDSLSSSHSPFVYQIMHSLSTIINDMHKELKTQYARPQADGRDFVDTGSPFTFSPEERMQHAVAIKTIEKLPFALAMSQEDLQEKKRATESEHWSRVLGGITEIVEEGGALLLKLFEDPLENLKMSNARLETIQGLFSKPFAPVTAQQYSQVYENLGDHVAGTIRTAINHKLDEAELRAAGEHSYTYAAQLVSKLHQETRVLMNSLREKEVAVLVLQKDMADWRHKTAQATAVIEQGIAFLDRRRTIICKEAPEKVPFDERFIGELASQMTKVAKTLEQALQAFEQLAETIIPKTEKAALCQTNLSALFAHANDDLVAYVLSGQSKTSLLAIHALCEDVLGDLPDISTTIDAIDAAKVARMHAGDKKEHLENALASAMRCRGIAAQIRRFGDEASEKALYDLRHDAPALGRKLDELVASGTLEASEEINRIKTEPIPANRLYRYLVGLKRSREAAGSPLPAAVLQLRNSLSVCEIPYDANFEKLIIQIEKVMAETEATLQETAATITSGRQTLLDTFGNCQKCFTRFQEETRLELASLQEQIRLSSLDAEDAITSIRAPAGYIIEATSVPDLPFLRSFIPPREVLKQQVIPIANNKASELQRFLTLPPITTQLFRRFLTDAFCQNHPK